MRGGCGRVRQGGVGPQQPRQVRRRRLLSRRWPRSAGRPARPGPGRPVRRPAIRPASKRDGGDSDGSVKATRTEASRRLGLKRQGDSDGSVKATRTETRRASPVGPGHLKGCPAGGGGCRAGGPPAGVRWAVGVGTPWSDRAGPGRAGPGRAGPGRAGPVQRSVVRPESRTETDGSEAMERLVSGYDRVRTYEAESLNVTTAATF